MSYAPETVEAIKATARRDWKGKKCPCGAFFELQDIQVDFPTRKVIAKCKVCPAVMTASIDPETGR